MARAGGGRVGKRTEEIFEDIVTGNFPNLMKTMNSPIEELSEP